MHLQTTHKTPQSEASPAMVDSTISTASSSSATAAAPAPAHCDVRQFHGLITCGLCQGYMIDPTTVDYCYHTYCRSCILKHLLRVAYCPQCKASGGKEISEINLRSDDTLRSLIYKLVPGLYRRECDQLVDFKERHRELLDADDQQSMAEPEFFTSADLVSLSLEYHPAMLDKCTASEVPPIIYLQCPAGLKVELLRRFLCSKYNIDAENKLVEVEVTYEDEVLPASFTLMDVGYCYKWTGHAPMAFCYRIMVYESERAKNDENNLSKINNQDVDNAQKVQRRSKSGKTVTFAEDLESDMDSGLVSGSPRGKGRSNKSAKASPPPKAKRLATAKRELEDSSSSSSVSSFKSLRSNDMRYCDYGVARVKSEPEPEPDAAEQPRESALPPHMNIVVSIPPSQLSCYVDEGDFELKTANKKGNLPKLKIELNSMRSKLSMPMSAEPRFEDTSCSVQQLDLETYAKNIGLKPIEPTHSSHCAPAVPAADSKYSPNASPMSSCSTTSTNGSGSGSNGLGIGDASMPTSSIPISNSSSGSGSHRKRKKKHSKEPKDSNGKRKKLHAEISSQTDGKMKVKITSNPTNNHHKAHKLDLKRSHSLAGGELGLGSAVSFSHLKLDETRGATSDALNRTLGEESRSISSLMTGAPTPPPTPTAETEATKLALVAKELALPASPPLPPSLFKAFTPAPAPAAVPTPTPTTAAPASKPKQQQHQQQQPAKAATKPPLSNNNNRKPSQLAAPGGHFVVPQPPTHANRNMYHMQRYLSTPSSIASSANKQPKRSVSVDESLTGGQAKQARLQQVQAMTSYAARFHMQANGNGPKVASASYQPNPQMRLYGPEMAKQQALPVHCPASISMSLPSNSLSSGSVTITPRGRPSQQMPYSFPEPASHVPALEIVRLGPSKQAGAVPKQPNAMMTGGRIMGPPAALPKQNQNQNQAQSQAKGQGPKRAAVHSPPMPMPLPLPMAMPMPMPIPAIVKSPPLSVALSGQRGSSHNYNNHKSKSNNNNNSNSNKNNNAAYRASPPALINLRNTVPLPFPSKSSAKADANSKKSPPAAAAGTGSGAGAAGCIGGGSTSSSSSNSQSKTNGTAALDPSKTGLREFRPPFGTALPAAATTTAMTTAPAIVAAAAALAKDADILDLSANPGRSSNSNSTTTTKLAGTNRAPTSTSPPAGNISTTSNSTTSNSSSSSLEAALNKIKQNISANSNSNGNGNGGGLTSGAAAATTTTGNGNITTTSSISSSSSSSGTATTTTSTGTGDDLQNLHLLSESATAREKISIKSGGGGGVGGGNIFENKPKNGNAVVRPQNASVRSIPNPSALAFRNQTTLPAAATATAATAAAATAAAAASMASAITKPLTVKAEEKPKMSSTTAPGLLSPTGSNGSSHSSSGCSAAATSPRALTKKPTTIDQVAANLNIRAEAKAAALAEEAPLVLTTSSSKSPELAKTTAAVTVPATTTATTTATPIPTTAVTSQPEIAIGPKSESTKETAITVSAASTLLSLPTAAGIVSQSEALPKPPVQIAATDTLAPVASSA